MMVPTLALGHGRTSALEPKAPAPVPEALSASTPEVPPIPVESPQATQKASPTMDAVVNPASSPATIIMDQDNRRHDGYTGKDAAAIGTMHVLNDISTASLNGVRETAEASRHNLRETADASRHGVRETAEVGRHGVRETSDASRHLADLITRGEIQTKDVDIRTADRFRIAADEICSVKMAVKDAEIRDADRFRAMEKDFKTAQDFLGNRINSTHLDLEKGVAQLRFETVSGFKESLIDSAKNAAAVALAQATNTAAIQLEAAKNAGAAALAACTNTAAIQAAIAACCCETQKLISAKADETEALINSLNTQNIQAQLADAKSKILALQLGVKVTV